MPRSPALKVRPMAETKVCMGCGGLHWPPVGKPWADFCDACFDKVRKGTCPRTGCSGNITMSEKGTLAEWPVVCCGAETFWERHGDRPRAMTETTYRAHSEAARTEQGVDQ